MYVFGHPRYHGQPSEVDGAAPMCKRVQHSHDAFAVHFVPRLITLEKKDQASSGSLTVTKRSLSSMAGSLHGMASMGGTVLRCGSPACQSKSKGRQGIFPQTKVV